MLAVEEISYTPRPFRPGEKRLLSSLRTSAQKKQVSAIRFYHYLIATVLAAIFIYIASIIHLGFFEFLFGTLGVFSIAFIVFMPYEVFKAKRKRRKFLQDLDTLLDSGVVSVFHVKATRAALAEEYEDENDLYIFELDPDTLLYLWDNEYNLHKKLPCLELEIYDESFFKLTGINAYPLSDRVSPVNINKKAKWAYIGKVGFPETRMIQKASFDILIDEINAFANEQKH